MFAESLSFIRNYIEALNKELIKSNKPVLSKLQQAWLGFCLTGLLLTNQLCWRAFERSGLGTYRTAQLSWMFRHSPVPWNALLHASSALLLRISKAAWGIISVDDSDHQRSKNTTRIYKAHKIYDKKTGGYFNGQCLVLILLITDTITIPIGFSFYRPDPKMQAWRKEDEKQKAAKIKKADRPAPPAPDKAYPSKIQIALKLIEGFHKAFPEIKIKAVVADAAYDTAEFMDGANRVAGCTQSISQLSNTQTVKSCGKTLSVKAYFARQQGTQQRIRIRGGSEQVVTVQSARLYVTAHAKKRFVVAMKYDGEEEYRYLVATDLSWRTLDIVQCYTQRWLVETFFEDWKAHEGWANLAKQPDEEGSYRGVILSLLLDHALLTHPEQQACLENRTPMVTVGSLVRATHAEALICIIEKILKAVNPAEMFEKLKEKLDLLFSLNESNKHMNTRDLGRLEPTPSLQNYLRWQDGLVCAEGNP